MRRSFKLGIAGAGTCALLISAAAPALADYAPATSDVVGIGSDTVQNMADFVADGDTGGDLGYNAAHSKWKLVSFDATPDANDRAGYLNGSSNNTATTGAGSTNLKPLNPTIVLRQGTNPVQRPNGSGAGIAALIAEGNPGANAEEISFVRMSRAPKASEYSAYSASVAALHQNTADTQLDVAKISDDPLEVAYATRDNLAHAVTSNIPAAGLTVAELTAIYNCTDTNWSQIPGATGSDTIIPLVPQTGSGTRSTFLGDLGITNPGPCVQTVEENDPTALTNAVETANSVEATTTPASGTASAADAIDPFSVGRLNLYNSGYFTDPTVVFPGGAALTPGIAVKTGTGTSPTSDIYLDNRGLYIVFRDSDLSDAAWQPGAAASQNWATVLFWSGANPSYMQSAAGAALIAAGGGVADYAKEPAGFTG